MNYIIQIFNKVNYITGLIMGFIILLIMTSVIYEVISRYLFNAPTSWSMEINQYLFCGVSLLGGGYCLLRDAHVRVDFLYPRLSPKGRAIVDFCTFPLALLFCGLLIGLGWEVTWDAIVGHQLSTSVLAVPMWWVLLFVPVAGVLLGIQIISRLLSHIVDIKSSDEKTNSSLK